jgi:hypothetical protein
MEEEEKRRVKVEDLQSRRRLMKEEKEKEKLKEEMRNKPMSRPSGYSAAPRSSKPTESGPKRSLPDYYAKPKPSGISTRAQAKKVEPTPTSSYQPKARGVRKLLDAKEEEKQNSRKPISKPDSNPAPRMMPKQAPKPAPVENKYSSYSQDVDMYDNDEIPAELLNQIYSEDLDDVEVKNLSKIVQEEPPRAQRLIGGDDDMDVDYRRPPRVEPRRVSPPPRQENMMPPVPRPEENDNELLQKAIAASLADNNPRHFPMGKFNSQNSVEYKYISYNFTNLEDDFDTTMNDPEMLEAIARSMQEK